MIKLRDYQMDMVIRTRESLRNNHRVLLQSPTGSGKTAIACHMMREARNRGMSSFFLVHQRELLKQTSKSMWENKIEHGIIASGRGSTPNPIQVASVMTLKNRLSNYKSPSLIIIDETHRALAPSYMMIAEAFPTSMIVGLTATPQRTDGRGLGHLFEDIVLGPPIRYLIEEGYLCDYEIYGVPLAADIDHVKTKAGDYDKAELSSAMNKPKVTGDAVENYKRRALGEKAVVMCVDVKHADSVAEEFNRRGVKAESIHSKSKDRDGILDRFENGDTDLLTAVDLLIEGVDLPIVSVIIWLRPTQSIVVWMQGNGRGFRIYMDGKVLKIFDHVNNWARHGLPCSERDWSLLDKPKGKGKPKEELEQANTCAQCSAVYRLVLTSCPVCGCDEVVKRERQAPEQVDGEIVKLDHKMQVFERKKEQGTSRTLEDLITLGLRRGIKNPSGWAANVRCARDNRKPGPSDYKLARETMMKLQQQGAA